MAEKIGDQPCILDFVDASKLVGETGLDRTVYEVAHKIFSQNPHSVKVGVSGYYTFQVEGARNSGQYITMFGCQNKVLVASLFGLSESLDCILSIPQFLDSAEVFASTVHCLATVSQNYDVQIFNVPIFRNAAPFGIRPPGLYMQGYIEPAHLDDSVSRLVQWHDWLDGQLRKKHWCR